MDTISSGVTDSHPAQSLSDLVDDINMVCVQDKRGLRLSKVIQTSENTLYKIQAQEETRQIKRS